jgi:hypothetical protein
MDIFKKPYYIRLKDWSELRKNLEISATPIQDAMDYWKYCPRVKLTVDTHNRKTWPTPWEAIKYNEYCDFLQLYMIGHTLKLTQLFSASETKIYITRAKDSGEELYFLLVKDTVVGYSDEEYKELSEFPSSVEILDCFDISNNT